MNALCRAALLMAAVALSACAPHVVKSGTGGASGRVEVPAESSRRLVLNVSGGPRLLQRDDWAAFRAEWRAALAKEAGTAALDFETQDGQARPSGQAGTLVAVQVSDYHWVSTGERMGFGLFTGNAFIEARVRFLDLRTGRAFGEQAVSTNAGAVQGAFSPMTDRQLMAIAKAIVADIDPR
jgi:hypothetical protein